MKKQIQNLFRWVLVQFVSINCHSGFTESIHLELVYLRMCVEKWVKDKLSRHSPTSKMVLFRVPQPLVTVTDPGGMPMCVGLERNGCQAVTVHTNF